MLPTSGLYVRHANGIQLRDIEFRNPDGEARPTLIFDDAHDITVDGLRTTRMTGAQPVIATRDVTDMWVRNSAAPKSSASFIRAEGTTSNIVVSGCNLREAAKPVDAASNSAAVTLHNNL